MLSSLAAIDIGASKPNAAGAKRRLLISFINFLTRIYGQYKIRHKLKRKQEMFGFVQIILALTHGKITEKYIRASPDK